jgi:glycosyltransferase involved in cell wall biosynthesis
VAKGGIQVIPNPVEVPPKSKSICESLPGLVRIATILNGWGTRKNPKAAIKAFSLLQRRVPNTELFMYGYDFEEDGPASKWAARNGFSQNIHFCGFLEPHDLQRQLREMSLVLHPAREEACPLTLLESMALGLPIVAGRHAGGVPWVLDEGRAGFLTDVEDPEKMAETLFMCIKEPRLRTHKQKQAFERLVQVFSPDSVAEQYEKAYQKVLSQY